MMNRMAVEISSDPRDVETYLLGIGEYPNTSLVLMEHGYNTCRLEIVYGLNMLQLCTFGDFVVFQYIL